jgi:hypothetical protein
MSAGVLALTALAVAGGLYVRLRTGTVLDDFDGRFRIAEWTFEPGIPGHEAAGGFSVTNRGARSGARGGELRFDFRRGGPYVQATLPLRFRGPMGGIRFWARASSGQLLAIRVRDGENQVFQREIGLAPRDWEELSVPFTDWTDSYGGRGDGIMRGEPRAIALVVANTSPQATGCVWFDDIRRLAPRAAPTRWSAVLPPHPRLLASAHELAERRRVIVRTPWLQALLADHASQVRAAVTAGIRIPTEGGQCEHWYACPVHGAGLRMEGPKLHVCPVDGRAYTGRPYDQVWVTKQHKRLARLARQAAIVYALSDDPIALGIARRIVTEYARRYAGYRLHDIHDRPGRGGKVLSQSLDDAAWLVPILQAADLIYAHLSDDERRSIVEELIRLAVAEVIRPGRLRFHNIQCWHNAAIGLGGFFAGDKDLIAEAITGARGFEAQARHMVNQDGMWAEGSWGYHFYALDALAALAEAARVCGHDLTRRHLRPMFAAPLLGAMPDGTMPRLNDDGGRRLNEVAAYELAAARFGDRDFAGPLRASRRDSIWALLYGPAALPSRPTAHTGSRLMPDSGFAVLAPRTDHSAWACVKYGPHGGDHGHPDKNGIVVYGGGRPIIEDPGIGAYLTGMADGWFKSTVAHNTVAAGRADQAPATGSLVAFATLGDGSASCTDAGHALPGILYRRAAFLIGAHTLVVVDLLRSRDGTSHDFDLIWRPSGRWARKPSGRAVPRDGLRGYRYLANLRSETVGPSCRTLSFLVARDEPRHMTVSASDQGAVLIAGDGPGASTAERTPIAIVRRRSRSTAFVTAIALEPGRRPPRVRPAAARTLSGAPVAPGDAIGAEVATDTGRWLVVANPDALPIRCGGLPVRDALTLHRMGDAAP